MSNATSWKKRQGFARRGSKSWSIASCWGAAVEEYSFPCSTIVTSVACEVGVQQKKKPQGPSKPNRS